MSAPDARAPRARRRTTTTVLTTLALAAGMIPAASPALAAPLTPAVPTVYISQVVVASTPTTLRTAVQSRLAQGGDGGVTITSIGQAPSQYNAIGYRVADGYVYGVGLDSTAQYHLVRIGAGGETTDEGAIAGLPTSGSYAAGAFGVGAERDVLYVKTNTATSNIYAVDVVTRTVVRTIDPTLDFNAIDFTMAEGFLWGVEIGAAPSSVKTLVRVDPQSGATTRIATGTVFPAADTSGYGAAWTYGNGNLAFSNNTTGSITQIRVTDPASATPGLTKVSTIAGPGTSSNDGTTTPSAPADLRLAITQPAPAAPSSPIGWTVAVSNAGAGGSSGGTFSFAVPTGVTGTTLPTGCTVESGVVQCVTGELPVGVSDTYVFTATSPAAGGVSTSSTVTIVGNEQDPTDNTAVLVVAPLPQALASTGVGTAVQTVAPVVPGGATVRLLDDGAPVTSLAVPGQGAYAVTGSTLTFTPVLGFAGTPTPAAFTVTSGAESGSGTYAPGVTRPVPPVAGDHTSTGVGTAVQSTVVVAAPTGGTLTLPSGPGPGAASGTVVVAGQGTYTLDAAAATISFTPLLGYAGAATPVTYRVTDAYGQSDDGTYTPTITAPAAPAAPGGATTGVGTAAQGLTVTVPAGGSVTLLDASGDPAASVTVPGQGTATLTGGTVTFTPVLGFQGTATPVVVRVTDAYGQPVTGTYTATVTPPAPPVAVAHTSTGTGTAEQHATITAPPTGSWSLLDADGDPAASVTVPGQGTYDVVSGGRIRFTPVLGFDGTATPVAYRVTDAYGQPAPGSYTPTVTPPAGPAAPGLTSTGTGTAPQLVTVAVPAAGSWTLLAADGSASTSVVVPGQGTYDAVGTEVRFSPVLGFAGVATPAPYRVTDAYGQTATGPYTPTVRVPLGPVVAPVTTSGVATAVHQVSVPFPAGGSVRLLDGAGPPATTVVRPGVGTWTLDPATGGMTFAPVLGFHGVAPAVLVAVTDVYGQVATSTYVASVVAPAAPVVAALTSAGPAGARQSPALSVTVPAGGSLSLVDASGASVATLAVPAGTYTVDAGAGTITFTPSPGFAGGATPVTYRVVDAYGQVATATYAPTVAAAPAALPVTGVEVVGTLLAAGMLAALGAVLLLAARRRRAA